MKKERYLFFLSVIFWVVLIWSGIGPKDRYTWILEVVPGVAGFILLAAVYKRFRFTNLLYTLICIHCIILFVGGRYTYAEVPLFNWIKDAFHSMRNNYDKVGHFAQGFVPTLITREALVRLKVVRSSSWTNFLVICVALAISAVYELAEWATAILSGTSADAFLGTQGYVWDTQSDMFWALAGSICSLLLFSRYHDRAMKKLMGDR